MAGCTSTTITTPTWSLKRISFLQKADIADASIGGTNGVARLKGYKSDGGAEVAAMITQAAVEAAIKGAKP